MSKELIERLRADAESTDDIGLCADAAERIEELERERDAFYMGYRMKCDEETKDSALVIIERDQLREQLAEREKQVNMLREIVRIAIERGDLYISDQIQAEAALAATEEA